MPHHCHDECSHEGHDHSNDIEPAQQNLLYSQIDFAGIRTLNEKESGSGRAVLEKEWTKRLDEKPEIETDADEQLIVHVPFISQARLHSIHIRTSASSEAPKTLHLYANSDDLDFTSLSGTPPKATQTIELSLTSEVQDIPLKRPAFAQTRNLCMFFSDNFSDGEEDVTRISYIGFKGDWMHLSREPVDVLYEAAARPSDHKIDGQVEGAGFANFGGGGREGM